jgi:hypothetical protein
MFEMEIFFKNCLITNFYGHASFEVCHGYQIFSFWQLFEFSTLKSDVIHLKSSTSVMFTIIAAIKRS